MIKSGTVMFFGWEVEQAREYIRVNGFTQDQVRICRNGENVLVISKTELWHERD